MFKSTLMGFVYGIISTFVLVLITSWITGIQIKKGESKPAPAEAPHH